MAPHAGQPTLRQNAGARGKCTGLCSEDTGQRGGAAARRRVLALDHMDMRTDDDGPSTTAQHVYPTPTDYVYSWCGMSKM